MESDLRQRIRVTMIKLARQRGIEKSLCPSEVARRVMPSDWRNVMAAVRSVAEELVECHWIEVLQGGKPVRIQDAKGPVRIRISTERDVSSSD